MRSWSYRALALLITIVATHPTQADWSAAKAAYEAGDYAAAEAAFVEALEKNPEYSWTHFMLGLCRRQLNKTDEALANLDRAVELAPEKAEFRLELAQLLLSEGSDERVIEVLEPVDASELEPQLGSTHARVFANAALRLGREQEAVSVLERQLAIHDADPTICRALGSLYKRQQRPLDAFDLWARAYQLDQQDRESARRAMKTVMAQPDPTALPEGYDIRAAELAAALARASGSHADLRLAGETALWARRFEEAAEWCERASEINPRDSFGLYLWGRSLAALGRLDEAVAAYSKALKSGADGDLALRIHTRMARAAECRLDAAAAAKHLELAGRSERAEQMRLVAERLAGVAGRRAQLERSAAGLQTTLPDLEAIGDEAGQKAVRKRLEVIKGEIADLDKQVAEVRQALSASCGD